MREKTFVADGKPVRMCRRPGCGRPAQCRGLCMSDYHAAYKLVADGLITWAELESKGKVSEPRKAVKEWFLGK